MAKSYKLDSGFLILYEWLPALEVLPPEDFKALVMALIDRQRNETPFPSFDNQLTDIFARTFEPVIMRRLDGQRWQKTAKDPEPTAPPTLPPSSTPLPYPPTLPPSVTKEKSREEKSREDKSRENKTAPRSSPPTGSGVGVMDERFTAFWKAYPKKQGKKAAEKAFKKIKPSAALLETMLNAIGEQRASDQWRKDNGQFIPNPAKWLNQGRWEDEATETATTKNDISLEEFFNG